ncbi:hypothetical protein VNO80_05947 [Phaseolus coccineus]|uniref:Uncharacterized protein n=1 Tax=Phaseolus coccineus TaxID=3886 RepID=A0AAN9NMZ0_PHACN
MVEAGSLFSNIRHLQSASDRLLQGSDRYQLIQDNENALLQQALAMSMDDPAISHDVRDTDMSEAATDDPELALGEFLCLIVLCLNMGGYFLIMLIDD